MDLRERPKLDIAPARRRWGRFVLVDRSGNPLLCVLPVQRFEFLLHLRDLVLQMEQ